MLYGKNYMVLKNLVFSTLARRNMYLFMEYITNNHMLKIIVLLYIG
jgi:hypothetical protein